MNKLLSLVNNANSWFLVYFLSKLGLSGHPSKCVANCLNLWSESKPNLKHTTV